MVQQCHCAFYAPSHQVAVRRLTVGKPELATEVPRRHVCAPGERLDVEGLRVVPVDPVANAPQEHQVVQVTVFRRTARLPITVQIIPRLSKPPATPLSPQVPGCRV